MSYIDDNANRYLLLGLVLIALAIAGLTVFYQESFHNINTKYFTKVSQLNQTFGQLLQTQQIANKTREELLLKTEREQDLSSKYIDVRTQKDQLSKERLELLAIKENLETQLSAQTALAASLGKELNRTKDLAASLQGQINDLQSQLAACQARPCKT
ncbi:hypothetical protein HZB00_02990 [Candidatus Woesearchaeota archaeon]|nr:hypothetical protein [Candidatus Woesearchaeota archaeon]